MINIYTSRKLEKFLKSIIVEKNDESEIDNLRFNAHLFLIDRKKCILFTQKGTYYSFAIINFKVSDLKNIAILFYTSFESQLKSDGLFDSNGEKYLKRFASKISFHQTDNDQRTLGNIRDSIYRIDSWRNDEANRNINLVAEYILRNQNAVPLGSLKYQYSREAMKTEILNQV